MTEVFIVACRRCSGLPLLAKAAGGRIHFTIDDARAHKRELAASTPVAGWAIFRCAVEIVEQVLEPEKESR